MSQESEQSTQPLNGNPENFLFVNNNKKNKNFTIRFKNNTITTIPEINARLQSPLSSSYKPNKTPTKSALKYKPYGGRRTKRRTQRKHKYHKTRRHCRR